MPRAARGIRGRRSDAVTTGPQNRPDPGQRRFPVVVLDCDGVIIESTDIKARAFGAIFSDYPDAVPQIVHYHRQHGGLARELKLQYILGTILGVDASAAAVASRAASLASQMRDALLACPEVPGLRAFLAWASRRRLFVASGTPDGELREILTARSLAPFFERLFGSSRTKTESIREIARLTGVRPEAMLFVGDAGTDADAAREMGVPFVARLTDDRSIRSTHGFPEVVDLAELTRLLEAADLAESAGVATGGVAGTGER